MDAVTRYVAAVMRDDRYTEPRFVAWVDQAIAEMRDCLDDQGLHLDGEGVAPAALVVLMYLRQGLDEYVVSSGLAQEDVAIETMTGGMVALAHLIHQQRTPPLLPTTSRASNPMVGIRRAALGGSILRRLRQARVGRALRLLRNVEARLAWLRRGEAQVQQELAGCLDPDRQTDLKRRLDLVRDEITRTEGLLR
jgi:hypothetical protein